MESVPDLLTVAEAARILRIGKTRAYDMAKQHQVTGGATGLPVVKVGKLLRVPRERLEAFMGTAITAIPNDANGHDPSPAKTAA